MLMAHGPVGRVVELAVRAEASGFRRCWVYDEGLHTRDVWVTLAAIAGATERIPIGPGITNPYTRHPGVTAMAAASLAELSGGRAFLGLGAGGGVTLGPLGIDRTRPAATVGSMVDALRSLWAGETVDVAMPSFRLMQARLGMAPVRIPVWLAGRGPSMMRLGSLVADGFHLSFLPKRHLGAAVAAIRAGGRPLRVSYSTMILGGDEDLPEARRQLAFRLPDQPREVLRGLGVGPDTVSAVRAALAEGGPALAAGLVRDAWLTEFVLEAHSAGAELAGTNGIDEFAVPVLDLDRGEAALAAAAEVTG